MFSPNERAKIIALINREVVPAIGCTEPIAVALCTARAAELLDTQPEKIEVRLSANILKNAMGVGIPGTGMIGLPIAVALGALVGRSEYRLEVLRDVTPEAVGRGARYIDEKRVCISLKEDIAPLFAPHRCRPRMFPYILRTLLQSEALLLFPHCNPTYSGSVPHTKGRCSPNTGMPVRHRR